MTAEVVPARSLAECEQVIERGLAVFTEVGAALIEIRDRRLYRQSHGTFEEYCEQRWGFSRSRAYRIIEATQTTRALSPIGDTPLPANEGQARELRGLPAAKAAEVMTRAAESGPVTAAGIREARAHVAPRPEPRPEARHLSIARPAPPPDPAAEQHFYDLRRWRVVAEAIRGLGGITDTYMDGCDPAELEPLDRYLTTERLLETRDAIDHLIAWSQR